MTTHKLYNFESRTSKCSLRLDQQSLWSGFNSCIDKRAKLFYRTVEVGHKDAYDRAFNSGCDETEM
jgi:hypothetical protein